MALTTNPFLVIVTNTSLPEYASTDIVSQHRTEHEAIVAGEHALRKDPRAVVRVARMTLELTAEPVIKRASIV
jgi:hypothetical protein